MIFALDATPLTVPTGGIRRYTESLSRALAFHYPADEFHLISDQPFEFDHAHLPNLHAQTIPARRWWSLQLPRTLKQMNADLFHGMDFAVPYLPTRPSVLTLHDLSPWRSSQPTRVRRRTPILLRTGIATMVITPSETIRKEAIEHFGLKPERVAAIPLAASETFRPVNVKPPAKPYFLFVGTLEPRKNIARLVEAWREVRKQHAVELWIAGRTRDDFAPPQIEPGLRLLGVVPDKELPALYSGTAAFLYPSLYEGFGLPVLEAMRCGALVITSRDPAITEVTGGTAGIHIEADDLKALAEAMRSSLTRNHGPMRAQALARAREFSWHATARCTREVYDEAIRVFSRS